MIREINNKKYLIEIGHLEYFNLSLHRKRIIIMDDQSNLREAYKTAIEARNFHYSNYNKWMTFYYVAIGTIFIVAFSNQFMNESLSGVFGIGLIVSVLWHLSCKGYYLWIIHWILVIFKLEEEMDDKFKVYSIFTKNLLEKNTSSFSPIKPANISTSKATLLFSWGVCFFWAYKLISLFFCPWYFNTLLSALLVIVLVFILGKFLPSNLSQHKHV
jgi:hypothetical protein